MFVHFYITEELRYNIGRQSNSIAFSYPNWFVYEMTSLVVVQSSLLH